MFLFLKIMEVSSDGSEIEVLAASRPVLKPTSKACGGRDEEEGPAQKDLVVTTEEKEKIMKKFYNFEKESVYIPEELKNRSFSAQPGKMVQGNNGDTEDAAPATKEVDVDAVFENFVAESSDEDEIIEVP